ncbi:F-box only protein 27-like [Bos javanicus]|uniref:F-box only protein 27-like n=1 Tax=Bos javanicus TaxID=9906 RepID=UPI002AA824B1|nr:F-box only protein 27-like [Bos javanicus]
MQAAAGPGEETMGASTSWGLLSRIPAPHREAQEAPSLNQLPIEMLRKVLSYLPPSTLLWHCRPVCQHWRDLVDGWDLWRSILPWKHPDLWPVILICLPPADNPRPCILGRFCELRPIGHKLTANTPSKDLWNCMMLNGSNGSEEEEDLGVRLKTSGETSYSLAYRCWYKGEISDMEEEGLCRELLDSGKIWISVCHCWTEQQGSDQMYQVVFKLLDANYAISHYFFHKRFSIRPRTGSFSFRIMHAFTSIKKGVHFVLFDHSVKGYDSWPEQCGVCRPQFSVIIQIHP